MTEEGEMDGSCSTHRREGAWVQSVEGRGALAGPSCRWEANITMYLRRKALDGVLNGFIGKGTSGSLS
jgi:hypothetical protein